MRILGQRPRLFCAFKKCFRDMAIDDSVAWRRLNRDDLFLLPRTEPQPYQDGYKRNHQHRHDNTYRYQCILCSLVASVTEGISVFGTHWKSFTPAQYCVEKNTLSGALLNSVFMRINLPNVIEFTLSISC